MRIQDFNKFKLNEIGSPAFVKEWFKKEPTDEELISNASLAKKLLAYIKNNVDRYNAGNKVIWTTPYSKAPIAPNQYLERIRVKESKNRLKIDFVDNGQSKQKSLNVTPYIINDFKKLIDEIGYKEPEKVETDDFKNFVEKL
jgi:hypothetical protein